MTDIDLIANLDPATGLPLVDTRSAARRWLEALAYGSEHHDVTKAFHIKKISAKSGPEKQHQQQVCGSDLREISNNT